MTKPSKTAQKIIDSNIGYRNDTLFSGDDYLIQETLKFEIYELDNDDILDYLNVDGINDVLDYIDKHLPHHKELYAYWFTSKDAVQKLYAGDTEPISEFKLPQKYLILSDLDDEGILIVSETPKSELEQSIL